MPEINSLARWLIVIGLGIAAVGGLLLLAGRIPILNQLGRLPGDIRYTSADGRFGCFVPIVSSLVLSVILTIILNVVVRLLNK